MKRKKCLYALKINKKKNVEIIICWYWEKLSTIRFFVLTEKKRLKWKEKNICSHLKWFKFIIFRIF